MGGIMRDLQRKSHTFIKVDRFFPSTQLCPQCGDKRKLLLSERVYVCETCGYHEDRDLKSAIMIEREGLKVIGCVPTGRREFTLVEIQPLSANDSSFAEKVGSMKQEASAFRQR